MGPGSPTGYGWRMSSDDDVSLPGTEMDLAIDRALRAANLQPGDAAAASTFVVHDPDLHVVESPGDADSD